MQSNRLFASLWRTPCLFCLAFLLMSSNVTSQTNVRCGSKTLCSQMDSCDEAKLYLHQCRVHSLDRDNDGTPCEALCGDGSINLFLPNAAPSRLTPSQSAPSTQSLSTGGITGVDTFAELQGNGRFSCSQRKTCGRVISCEEALYHLLVCGNGRLDGDGHGHPCERRCGDESTRTVAAAETCRAQGLRLNVLNGLCQSR